MSHYASVCLIFLHEQVCCLPKYQEDCRSDTDLYNSSVNNLLIVNVTSKILDAILSELSVLLFE